MSSSLSLSLSLTSFKIFFFNFVVLSCISCYSELPGSMGCCFRSNLEKFCPIFLHIVLLYFCLSPNFISFLYTKYVIIDHLILTHRLLKLCSLLQFFLSVLQFEWFYWLLSTSVTLLLFCPLYCQSHLTHFFYSRFISVLGFSFWPFWWFSHLQRFPSFHPLYSFFSCR